MNKSKTFILITTVIVTALALITGCGNTSAGKGESAQAGSDTGKVTTVNVAINGGISPLSILKDKGWLEETYEQQGAKVSWSEFQSGPPLLEALVAGRVDLSFLGDGATLSGLSSGLPFQVIWLISEGGKNSAILVPQSSDIQRVEDLKGKTIGVAKGTTGHVYLIKVLTKHGLKESDVTIVNLQPEDASSAFISGKLDAWATWEPYISLNTENGKGRTIAWEDEGILAPASMIGANEFLSKYPELVTTFIQQYKRAADWIHNNKDEASQYFAEQKKLSPAFVKSYLDNSNSSLQPYTEQALTAQQESADLLLKSGFLKKELNFKSKVNDSFVLEALK